MPRRPPKLKARRPKSVFQKPLKADFKELFLALSKGVAHAAVGKWDEIATDAVDAMSAVGLSTEPEELAFLLIRRAVARAVFDLVGENAQALADGRKDGESLDDPLEEALAATEIYVDQRFLEHPEKLPVLSHVEALLRAWLQTQGMDPPGAASIGHRLPAYFIYALNQEWRQNSKAYTSLIEVLNTPFARAGEREWAWAEYASALQRRVQESVFNEHFGLRQIFVPLHAFYFASLESDGSPEELSRNRRGRRRVAVSLESELERWLQAPNASDAIRVISGGPGSGKSSFARIFAAHVARTARVRVLFVPLHLIDPGKDLVDEVGRFVRDEGILLENPLHPDSQEQSLLIIFDGLDELASQGKAAAETARAFVREVERTVERRNHQEVRVRVLISGRELVVQENESEFRKPGQILTLLPYFVPKQSDDRMPTREVDEYEDPSGLLGVDLRQQWWAKYGELTGRGYLGLPAELSREDLSEVTGQPLLNYLVALSFSRDRIDFTGDINLNSIYADLVAAVHERGYEKRRPWGPIRHMKVHEFSRVLEEIGLAAWHGDGRTTTVSEIEHHCRVSGLGALLDVFQEGAKAGVTRLLAAFFFRQYGQRATGDPTFVFTHKSFGEYLTARRIVRAIERLVREMGSRSGSPDEGWDEREALRHWAQICGPSAITQYLHVFLLNEVRLRPRDEIVLWQGVLARLFSYALRHGLPMEQLHIAPFKEAMFQSRNAEEALLVAWNACARMTRLISSIEAPDPTAFGAWFRRIQGQRTGPESILASRCLSFLDLEGAFLDMGDMYGADLSSARLAGVKAHYASCGRAVLEQADLSGARLGGASFEGANLSRANLEGAYLAGANFRNANLRGVNFHDSLMESADLSGADLSEADLQRADLRNANLSRANLRGANLDGARVDGVTLDRAKLDGVRLEGVEVRSGRRGAAVREFLLRASQGDSSAPEKST